MRGHYDDMIERNMIPFVQCGHSGEPEWTPAHYRIGRVTHLISCIVCLATFTDANVDWLTPAQATERHGWSVVSSESTSTAN